MKTADWNRLVEDCAAVADDRARMCVDAGDSVAAYRKRFGDAR